MKATILSKDDPIIDFEIVKSKLIHLAIHKENFKYFPLEFKKGQITVYSINQLIKYRLVADGSQMIKEYLNDLGLDTYDVDKIIYLTNGLCSDDVLWFRFEDKEIQKWEEVPGRRLDYF